MKNILSFALLALLFAACGGNETEETTNNEEVVEETYTPLPYIGMHDIMPGDTVYHSVPAFELINQDSTVITNEAVVGKVHVANFFFTSCPSICPAMIEQMKRLQEMTNDIEELVILSHTIDPERDSIPKLRAYIEERNIDTHNWHFLYGERQYIHDLGKDGYMVNAMEDDQAEGGFLHSEHFVLVDREGHIRGLYTGTDTEEVNKLNEDIRALIANEYE